MIGTKRAASSEDEDSSNTVTPSGHAVPQRGRHAAKRQRRAASTSAEFHIAGPSNSGPSTRDQEVAEDDAEGVEHE